MATTLIRFNGDAGVGLGVAEDADRVLELWTSGRDGGPLGLTSAEGMKVYVDPGAIIAVEEVDEVSKKGDPRVQLSRLRPALGGSSSSAPRIP